MSINIATSPKIDTAFSSRCNWKSSRSSHHPSRSYVSLLSTRFHLAPQKRFAVLMITLLFTILINNPNTYYLVHSLSTVSTTTSTRRPTTNFERRYDSVNRIQQRGKIQQLQFATLLFQSITDANENENNEASAANNSPALDDDSVTVTAATPTIDRTSFDDAGRSLLDEQDMKRMNEMGDFDVNPNVCIDTLPWCLLFV
jgi:hypothetical protein